MKSEWRFSRRHLALPAVQAVGLHVLLAALFLVGFSVTHPSPDRFELPPTLTANLMLEPQPQPVREQPPTAQPAPEPAPQPKPEPRPQPQPEPSPPAPKPEPQPEPEPAPQPQPTPEPAPQQPKAQPEPEPTPPAETAAPQNPAPPVNSEDAFSDLLAGLDSEDSQLERQQEELAAAQAQRERDAEVTSTYTDRIYQQITRAWSRPMELQIMDLTGRETVVQVSLLPTGELLSAEIVSSSGIAALDQSAIRAVQRVRRYQVPDDINVFNRNFRTFRFRFKPEDLMQ
ncbi:protein TolA [Saccharospirillum sp. MSK14-1]|uniref:cell envelope integrity protein TolA n=1 Tax=Saccharospirillum sp. MSK14-1 TaxID=1897632 RepID=UPI000D3832DD|nr:cell envelope integrity protein TolA [Saccharospirillum sp. MSK14-1]PTY37117.1 protein TolA [Saccharospirillum sp. MSK14-1]